jgi:hypothetical protein
MFKKLKSRRLVIFNQFDCKMPSVYRPNREVTSHCYWIGRPYCSRTSLPKTLGHVAKIQCYHDPQPFSHHCLRCMASLLLNPKCSNKRVIHTVSKQGQSFEVLSDCLILTFNKPLIEIWSKTNVRQFRLRLWTKAKIPADERFPAQYKSPARKSRLVT